MTDTIQLTSILDGKHTYFDCYDCPNCGAQHVAKERYEKYADE